MKSLAALTRFTTVAVTTAQLAHVVPAFGQTPVDNTAEAEPLIGPPSPGGLTANEVGRRAAATSHEVRAREEETAAARAGVSQARAGFVPRLSLGARYTRLSSVDSSLGTIVAVGPDTAPGPIAAGTQLYAAPLDIPTIQNQYATEARLELPLSDYLTRLPQLHAAARSNLRSAQLLENARRLRTSADGKITFYGWARARLQAEVAARGLAQAEAHLQEVKTAQAAGSASRADLLRVESQVAAAELAVTRARAGVVLAEQRLRVVMHDTAARRYEVGEDLRDVPAASPWRGEGEEQLVARALAQRLEPQALAASASAVRSESSATRAASLPRLSGVASASYANPNSRIFPQKEEYRGTWDAGLQLTWSPTQIFGNEAAHTQGQAKARQLDAEHAQVQDSITLEVRQGLETLRESEAAMSTADRGLAAAEESYRVRRVLFRNGRATSVELTDAENERTRAQMESISARIDRRIAQVRLSHALGEEVTR